MTDRTLQQRLPLRNALLAPYAVPTEGILGRAVQEPADTTRFPFQRDRDRIIHTQAFRRLQGKTQVFVTGEGDHYRTRLTHTMEVAQISRDIARTIGVNEDLAECIALAHDLGHPPFGHTGEEGINEWMQQFGKTFEHNQQSHLIVTQLEYHSSAYPGLNLNQEVLDGLLKHQTVHDHPSPSGLRMASLKEPTLEAQLVNIADEITYTAHDSDDGLRAGLFTLDEILTVPLAQQAYELTKARGTSLRGALIDVLVTNLYGATEARLQQQGVQTLEDVYNCDRSLVQFDDDMITRLSMLRDFLWNRMYMHESVVQKSTEGKKKLQELLQALYNAPNDKIRSEVEQNNSALEDAVKNYVAGMTERYASEVTASL